MPFAALLAELDARRAQDLLRSTPVVARSAAARVVQGGKALVNFCSNDYLGLAAHPRLAAAMIEGVERYGAGSGASHLVCGHTPAHQAFDEAFASFCRKPAALSFATGYMANLGVITALTGRDDAVFADKLNHASLNDACLLSRADFKRFAHNNVAQLEQLLADSRARRKLIVVDGVFSMDGDVAPLADYLALAERFDAWLYVDDAHGFGVMGDGGRGSCAALSSPRLIYTATFGKAAGLSGAAVAGERVLIDYLINCARPYIYTTATPPALAHALLESLRLIEAGDALRAQLASHIADLRAGLAGSELRLMDSASAIQPLQTGSSADALALSGRLRAAGLLVSAIRPPTVPTPRLRICLSAAHSQDDVAALLTALKP
ncbi:8-amino-7-oxononanoate synthase [Chitinibacteraceae bacterium HSL-7]